MCSITIRQVKNTFSLWMDSQHVSLKLPRPIQDIISLLLSVSIFGVTQKLIHAVGFIVIHVILFPLLLKYRTVSNDMVAELRLWVHHLIKITTALFTTVNLDDTGETHDFNLQNEVGRDCMK